jgi:hypothetical protein
MARRMAAVLIILAAGGAIAAVVLTPQESKGSLAEISNRATLE